MKIQLIIVLIAVSFPMNLFAAGQLEILKNNTPVYDGVSEDKNVVGKLQKGKVLKYATHDETNRMYCLKTKSGKNLCVSEDDVKTGDTITDDLYVENKKEKEKQSSEPQRKYLSYDLGGSTGSYNGNKFFELSLGLNWHILSWFTWRNSFFYKTYSEASIQASYGVDSTLRGDKSIALGDAASLNFFLGGGYRFINTGKNAPVAEAGTGLNLGKLSVTGSVKQVFHSMVTTGAKDEIIYGVNLSGATSGWL